MLDLDYLHLLLLLIITIVITINNLSIVKRYYYPWFFSSAKKITKAVQKCMKGSKKKLYSKPPSKKMKPESSKKAVLYMNVPYNKLKKIQQNLSWKYQVAVTNLNSNLNIGAIYRTGCLLGMDKYIILGKKIYNPRSQVGLDCVGIEYLNAFDKLRDRYDSSTIENFDVNMFQKYVHKNHLIPILIEQGGINLLNVNFSKKEKKLNTNEKYVFVFGNETHGVPSNLISLAKKMKWMILSIPQWGTAHSYNVSQAANIIMWKYYHDSIHELNRTIAL